MNSHKIIAPSLGESVSEATIATWLKKEGEFVSVDETIVEIETDKVTLEVSAPVSGIIETIAVQEGGTIHVGDVLGFVKEGSVGTNDASKDVSSGTTHNKKQETASTEHSHVAMPSAEKHLKEKGLRPEDVTGTGKDGRILKGDVLAYKPIDTNAHAPTMDEKEEKRVPMSKLRQRIAERLKEAQNTAAILTTFNEVDMSAVMDLRTKHKSAFEKKYGIKLGFMSFFIKASVKALREFPAVNGEIQEKEIVYKNYYDIGVAVSAPQGLVVPIIRDADLMEFAEIEQSIVNYGTKAKENKLTISDMTGGTFTISNGGVFGSLMSAPIINPPQSAILGMHKIQERPVVVNKEIVIRPMMYLALSYDHRIIDGREAVSFLVSIKESLENPEKLLLDL
jgi:2-oxoglutarate dehydrogenase E2 component (dihydrolipoamide succinyltransferase)